MRFLTFSLAGPLSSFGEISRWDFRETTDMPTKSAVIGLMGCCLGWRRGDDRLRELDGLIHMAVRRDRNGVTLTDFQTVQSPTGAILNAEHKPRGSTIITPKQYLQNAVFQVFLFGDEGALLMCERAMRRPAWVICLGRRSCPPARPVVPQMIEYDTVDEALGRYFDDRLGVERDRVMHCEIEALQDESVDRVITRQDAVIQASQNLYGRRRVRALTVKGGERLCI